MIENIVKIVSRAGIYGALSSLFLSPCFSTKEIQGAWIDLPSKDMISVKSGLEKVSSHIEKYHLLEKTNVETLNVRIQLLDEMSGFIQDKKEVDYKLSKLDNLIQKKSWYLKEIKNLYENKAIFDVFTSVKNEDNAYKPIFLINKILFDFNLPTYWGLFQLEVLDPCHRMLTPHYIKWKESGSSSPFFLWLEGQELSFRTLQMKFFSDEELNHAEIIVSKGFFFHSMNHQIVDYSHPEKEYIFSLSTEKKLLVTVAGELVRHTSMSRGYPVLGAGALKITNGQLTYIDAESGHYQPTPEALYQVLKILQDKGAIFNHEELKVMYYTEQGKILEKGSSFLSKYKDSIIKINFNSFPDFKI